MEIDGSDLYLHLFKGIKGLGIKKIQKIYNYFGDLEYAFNSSIEEFSKAIKDKNILNQIRQKQNNKDIIIKEIDNYIKNIYYKDIKPISFFNKKYPILLKKIKNPPIYLYIKGNLIFNELEKSISIIGTRNPSFYGHTKARSIAKSLAEMGYVIVSGLARGIDMEAHLGALENGGKTIAVLGHGVEDIYPKEHSELAQEIIREGALISEYNANEKMAKYNLVNRNRIISGLTQASLIIEGSLKSGTSHEVRFAKEQKKIIFALKPINYNRKVSELPLKLIDEGAIEVESPQDIMDYLNSHYNKIEEKKIKDDHLTSTLDKFITQEKSK